MNGHEFQRRVQKWAKQNALSCDFQARPGKGSHGRLYVGNRFTTLKDRRKEIGPGLLRKMLDDLGIPKDAF